MIKFTSPESGELLELKQDKLTGRSGHEYPVINGIPRFVSKENYASAFGLQWNTFRKTQLDSINRMDISRSRLERCLGQAIEELKGKSLLEVGCGAGRFTEILVPSGAEVHSVDLSNAVEANKENIGNASNFAIAQASVYALPFPDQAFDIVICLGVIQHTPSPEKTIESLWKKVKPGGFLVIDHYRWRLSYYSNLKPLYRQYLKRLKPEKSLKLVTKLTDFFFPLHWKWRNKKMLWWLLHRISPLIEYIHEYPEMSYQEHYELSKLDSYDSLTDYYKHLRTPGQIEKQMKQLGARNIWINVGGNGVEARGVKF
jgi:2-polyprenyl-3-methyl-5-hydroxy-6-metoxy-1,4-benzoquinol methylase